jgi:hypothetical protein
MGWLYLILLRQTPFSAGLGISSFHSWALTDYSVTSGTGLTTMTERRAKRGKLTVKLTMQD